METQDKPSVLVLGQTPPPYHGQAVMIQKIVEGNTDLLKKYFVRMNYSKSIDEVGKFNLKKIIDLFKILRNARRVIIREKIQGIYYPPTGAGRIALIRDIVSLLYLRRFKCKIIFHFHAMGLKDNFQRLGLIGKWVFRKAFIDPNLCICISEYNIKDIEFLKPGKICIVPYGVADTGRKQKLYNITNNGLRILFAGNIIPSKGIYILLDVVYSLNKKGYKVKADFMGGMRSKRDEEVIYNYPAVRDGIAIFHGICVGEIKDKLFRQADIFCFPTYYENENFPVVILEAMQYSLPIVSTRWRGIPSIIEEGVNGFMAEPGSKKDFELKLEKLILDKSLIEKMGKNSRNIYEERFTEEIYLRNIFNVLYRVVNSVN